jgi:exosortase H (IPTLxxWG-CTERM-specific)
VGGLRPETGDPPWGSERQQPAGAVSVDCGPPPVRAGASGTNLAGSEAQSPGGSQPASPRGPTPPGGFLSDPWFRFALVFGVLALSCEILYYAVLVDTEPLVDYLRALAFIAVEILKTFRIEAEVHYTLVTSGGFAVQIAHGCDAIQICALYSCAVVAFPAPWRAKLWGLLVGILWLQLLNQVRIASLVLIGRFYETIFETAHYTLWPSVLIVITVVSWIAWVRWATRDATDPESEPA